MFDINLPQILFSFSIRDCSHNFPISKSGQAWWITLWNMTGKIRRRNRLDDCLAWPINFSIPNSRLLFSIVNNRRWEAINWLIFFCEIVTECATKKSASFCLFRRSIAIEIPNRFPPERQNENICWTFILDGLRGCHKSSLLLCATFYSLFSGRHW